MKNFDERMEEIRRRAEALRKLRRRRRSIAACGVTAAACLCLALWNPVLGSMKQALPEWNPTPGSGELLDHSQNDCAVTEIRAAGMGEETALRDPEKILAFLAIAKLDIITDNLKDNTQASGNISPENGESVGTRGEAEDDHTLTAAPKGDPHTHPSDILDDRRDVICTLLLIRDSGEEQRYLLTGTGLVETETGTAYPLDGDRLQLLLELLEIG